MDGFIARANIDHYLDLLKGPDVPAGTRSTITKLLLDEENKLGREQEHLEFAESRATTCRENADRQRRLTDAFVPGTSERIQAERLLDHFEAIANLVESACLQMRHRLNDNSL
ncbi:hypothetical protein [Bradyrhizobium sp. UFLA03-84]|uniref:hypothetical protein n=1 Tax=Bradyrhizobium sp. UFLA03-84 TaxID=418599 RepID=UPI001FD9A1F5|nr:hypothetical protein [Bradyrhizobium sp. UFLA03-84]